MPQLHTHGRSSQVSQQGGTRHRFDSTVPRTLLYQALRKSFHPIVNEGAYSIGQASHGCDLQAVNIPQPPLPARADLTRAHGDK